MVGKSLFSVRNLSLVANLYIMYIMLIDVKYFYKSRNIFWKTLGKCKKKNNFEHLCSWRISIGIINKVFYTYILEKITNQLEQLFKNTTMRLFFSNPEQVCQCTIQYNYNATRRFLFGHWSFLPGLNTKNIEKRKSFSKNIIVCRLYAGCTSRVRYTTYSVLGDTNGDGAEGCTVRLGKGCEVAAMMRW